MSGSIGSNSSGNLELYSGSTKVLTADATTGVANFTKTPTAPTAASGTNNTQLATTAFVATATSTKANINSPTLNGSVLVLNGSYGLEFSATTNFPYIDFHSSDTFDDYEARISCDGNKSLNITANSITLSVAPTAPTAPAGTNTTQLATTAFVTAASNNLQTQINGKQNALGFNPVQQGTGVGQLGNTVKLGWSGSSLKCTIDVTDQGAIWTDAASAWSFSGNGYQKLPSGLIIQWGSYSPANANQQYTLNYPIAFPNNVLSTLFSSINSGTGATTAQGYSVSKSQISVCSSAANTTVSWIAIGY
jgi:hypothetical protein